MKVWARIFGLDLRALALARVAAGLIMLVDFLLRLRFVEAFYTQNGVAPRQLFLDSYASLGMPALHIANDSLPYQLSLLLVQALLALTLMLGYRTRLSSALSWYLLLSLHERNPMVLNSGDSLLAALMFWGMFLPWGRVWSLDARQAQPGAPTTGSVCSAATVGFCVQMVCLYLFAAAHKVHPYWVEQGTAVQYSLSVGHHATSAASWLLPYPELLKVLSRGVIATEFMLGLTLLLPWARWRTVILVLAMTMHLSFGLFLEVGIFRFTPLIGLLALLPLGRLQDPGDVPKLELSSPLTAPLLAVCLLTWAINLESLGKGKPLFMPQPLVALSPSLISYQHWGVFAGPGLERSGWFSVEVTAADGKTYDGWQADKPFGRERPSLISATYPDDRWRKFMMNLADMPQGSPYRQNFADWCRRQWNLRHPDNQARSVKVWQVAETTVLDGSPGPAPAWNLLGETGP